MARARDPISSLGNCSSRKALVTAKAEQSTSSEGSIGWKPQRYEVANEPCLKPDRRQPRREAPVTQADVCFGRGQAILKQRERIKLKTIETRRFLHRKSAAESDQPLEPAPILVPAAS